MTEQLNTMWDSGFDPAIEKGLGRKKTEEIRIKSVGQLIMLYQC